MGTSNFEVQVSPGGSPRGPLENMSARRGRSWRSRLTITVNDPLAGVPIEADSGNRWVVSSRPSRSLRCLPRPRPCVWCLRSLSPLASSHLASLSPGVVLSRVIVGQKRDRLVCARVWRRGAQRHRCCPPWFWRRCCPLFCGAGGTDAWTGRMHRPVLAFADDLYLLGRSK